MACSNCGGGCSGECCVPSITPGPRGRQGEPGAAPEFIAVSATTLPAGSDPTLVIGGDSPNLTMAIGIPAAPSPVFNPVVPTTVGVTPSASIDNTNPLIPQLSLVLVNGADGDDGISIFTTLTTGFTMPAVDGVTSQVDIGDSSAFPVGTWVSISGAGAPGYSRGWLVVASVVNPTSITLRNPGTTDGISPAEGYTAGLPQNAAPTVFVISNGQPNQIEQSGRPGPRGSAGAPGGTPNIQAIYAIPAAPPTSETEAFKIYYDQTPPTPATVAVFYAYNFSTATWSAGPNIVGTAGTLWFSGTADPNIAPPAGSVIGSYYLRSAGGNVTYYNRTGVSTWVVVAGPINLLGTPTTDVSHTVAGAYVIDQAVFSYNIDADADIELDWSSTNYAGQGNWTIIITNSSPSAVPINLTYTTLRWEQDPLITMPATIASGDVQILRYVRNMSSGLYTFTHELVPIAV